MSEFIINKVEGGGEKYAIFLQNFSCMLGGAVAPPKQIWNDATLAIQL